MFTLTFGHSEAAKPSAPQVKLSAGEHMGMVLKAFESGEVAAVQSEMIDWAMAYPGQQGAKETLDLVLAKTEEFFGAAEAAHLAGVLSTYAHTTFGMACLTRNAEATLDYVPHV